MKFISNLKRQYHFSRYQLRPFRPALAARQIAKRAISKMGGKQGFRIIDVALSYQCDLKCEHCSAMIMKQEKDKQCVPSLELDDYRKLVQDAKELDNLSWNITGGEPLLVPWLDELITIMEPKRHYVSIQSNCTYMDAKRAKELAKLGVNCVTTSLDSSIPEEHNAFRGADYSYDRVMSGLRNCREAGMSVLIGMTVTHQNLRTQETKDLIETANAQGAVVVLNSAVPCGRWKGNAEMVIRGDDLEYLKQLKQQYPMTTTDREVGRNKIGCPAGMEKIYVTPYGDVTPCPFIHIGFGNVKDMSLKDIVGRMRQVPHFSKYQDHCVAAEDPDFQKDVMQKIYTLDEQAPVSHQSIYGNLDGGCGSASGGCGSGGC